MQKKQRAAPVDRGRVDDIRAMIPGYGEFIPKGWGKFRVAPVIFWETVAVDHPVTTQGHSGGKAPKPPTPTVTDHNYLKSFAGVYHDGLVHGGLTRIWFDNDLVFQAHNLDAAKYEAEVGVLSGGASVAVQAECSGGKKVTGIGSGGKCTIQVNVPADGDYEMAVRYTSTADRTFKVYVEGAYFADLVCTASGAADIVAINTLLLTALVAGDRLIRFENAGAACPDLDGIDLVSANDTSPGDNRIFAGGVDPSIIPPHDQDHAWPMHNWTSDPGDGLGAGGAAGTPHSAFSLSKWGNPAIRIYRGTTTQNADSAIIAQEGAGSAPAYRGLGYLVVDNLQLLGGRAPNITVEVNQGVHSVPAIVTDIYDLVGVTADKLNLTALAGLSLGQAVIDAGTYVVPTYQNVTNATVGAGGAITKTGGANHTWDAHATSTASVASSVNGAVRFTASTAPVLIGFSTVANPTLTTDVIFGVLLNVTTFPGLETANAIQSWNGTVQSPDIGRWSAGDAFQVEIRNRRFRLYQNGIEIQNFTPSVPSYPLYPVVFMYDTNAGPSALTISTAGAIGDSPSSDAGGLLISSRKSGAEVLADLQTRFQFDMVEVDGVVKAILRNGTTADITISYTDMRAVVSEPGSLPELPVAACEISDLDAFLLPGRVDVNYLDEAMDYHNNVQSYADLDIGPQQDQQSVSLSVVDNADNMKGLAVTLYHKAHMESRTFKWATSWRHMHVYPGSIVTLTLPNATHTVRVTQARYQLPAGVIEFQGVRQAASLYSPSATGSVSSGFEPPITAHPANTKAVILDMPFLRAEDAGAGTDPIFYWAACGRGSGAWSGAFLYGEQPRGSGNYELLSTAGQASQIGSSSGALATVSDPSVWDRTNSLTVSFYTPTELSSASEQDLLANPELNLLAVKDVTTGLVELIQFKTASAGTPVAPYQAQYTVSTFLRGRNGTDGNVGYHTTGDDVVLIDSTIKPRRYNLADIGR